MDILRISASAFTDEATVVRALLAQAEPFSALEPEIMARAKAWTVDIREHGVRRGVEAFLHAYGLNTEEGVALMCLAEALLRIPDTATADALIESTFKNRHWEQHISGDSWLISLSSWGLLLTGKIVEAGDEANGVVRTLKNLVARLGEPVIREALKQAMKLIGAQFVLGETMKDALQNASEYAGRGYRFSFDILGEGARSSAQAEEYVEKYRRGIALIKKTVAKNTTLFEAPGISIKLSALHPHYQLTQKERLMRELLPRLKEIALLAKDAGITLAIDAEEATRFDVELLLFEALLKDEAFAGWNGIGFVAQAYQKRALPLIGWLAELAKRYRRVFPLRLVKGAYWDSEIKWAQLTGLPSYPVFTRKEHTDISYLACAAKLLSHQEYFYPQFATHNARTIASIIALAGQKGWKRGSYEFQRLHGMGEALHDMVIGEVPSRIYAPVGAHKDLLAYLIRRLLENGANSSFVHLLMDQAKTPEEILADPIDAAKAKNATPIPLPAHIYGTRRNSAGIDFGNLSQLEILQNEIAPQARTPLAAVKDISKKALQSTIAQAEKAFTAWSNTPVETRSAILEAAADALEAHRAELMALLAREAGRTLIDGLSEVREAADFCRYYATEARKAFAPQLLTGPVGESNQLSLHPRGIFACISPWNFPLSIFIGQIAAALAAGNCVIAKPAEQTPRIAARAIRLLHEAGIPKEALALAAGPGETIGAALVEDTRISGVAFTGGTDTAAHITRSLAARGMPIIPFIAETGGQNCMVVDSSALPEQAVDDILLSAFGSAGQRCSSLRILFVQEDIANELLSLLAGAMQELKLGDPLDPATDVGPVIDEAAQKMLLAHITKMKKSAELIASAPLPKLPGHFVAPHAFEIKSIRELTREIFGPVLHVVRFKAGTLAAVADAINSTGYGLTFGIHSRIEAHIRMLASRVRVGNIYVNRSMIGATVGVQPFGGEGLSGTGPKAGGPHTLSRFAAERVLTVNTAAIGGNTALLSSA